jgi:hypothetical protein
MAGQVAFTPTEADAVAATRDWFRRDLLQPKIRFALFGVAIAAALLGAGLSLQAGAPPGRAAWYGASAALAGMVLVALVLAVRYALLPGSARRNFRQNKAIQAPHVFAWTDDYVSWRSEGAHAQIDWRELYRWGEGASAFLFAVSERGVHFVPRRAFSEEQAADLRATAARECRVRF